MRLQLGILSVLTCASCAQPIKQPLSPPVSTAAAALAPLPIPTPRADHHLHLISPTTADVINGPPLPEIEVPQEFSSLLEARAQHWNNRAALMERYTNDAVVLIQREPKSGLFRGAAVAAGFLSSRFARPYNLTPVAFVRSGDVAHITGYYTRGRAAGLTRIGYFQLGLVQDDNGVWRIKSETPSFPAEAPQQPVTAEQAVSALDAAGIARAVVLSGAVAIGGRWLDIYHEQSTPAERYRLIRAENDWTAQQASRFPGRLVSFCGLNPLEPYAVAELRRCPASGHRGLKLHFDESGLDLQNAEHVARARAVFAVADAMGFPIVVHVGNNERTAAETHANVQTFLNSVVAAAPDIPIQIAHLWGGGGFSDPALAAYAEAVSSGRGSTRNLWFDMAEAPLIAAQYPDRKGNILQTIAVRMRQIGIERILFGSDAGGKGHLQPGEAWQQFRNEMPLTDEEFKKIAGNVAPYLR